MADKSDKDFGKRKPVSVPASPRPAPPPAKRSGHVALLLMGTFAVGSAAYALMPSRNCEPSPNAASPSLQQGNADCSSRSSSSSSQRRLRRQFVAQQLLLERFVLEPFILGHFRFRLAQRAARRLRLVRARRRLLRRLSSCSASPAPNATTGAPPPKASGFTFHTIDGERYWDERAYYAFTLNEIERRIEAPTAEIEAMCLELVGRAIKDEKYLRRLKIPEAFWPLIVRELAPPRCQPLRPAGPELRRLEPGETAGVQRRYADLDFRSGGLSVDLARTGDGAQHHPEARRPVQFNP